MSVTYESWWGLKPGRWFLLTGNRLAVTVVLLVGFAGPLFAAGALGLVRLTTASRTLWFLNGTVNGLLTLIPISVGVNQIVLSHEFGSIGSLYERRKDLTQFREQVERQTNTPVSSPRPSAFFQTLLRAVSDTAASVERGNPSGDDPIPEEVERYLQSVGIHADQVSERVAEEGHDALDTLVLVLTFEDTVQFNEARRLQTDIELSEKTTAKLDDLEKLFTQIDAARQYLKTIVIERQLARLSRLLVYTGVVAIAVAAVGIFTYRDVTGLALSRPALVVIAGTIVTVTLIPLAVLSAYILRVATIARQTAAFGPFVAGAERQTESEL